MRKVSTVMLAFHIIVFVWAVTLFIGFFNSDYPNNFLTYLTDISDGKGIVLVVTVCVVDGIAAFIMFVDLLDLIIYGKRKL
jgi:hypothetical protein